MAAACHRKFRENLFRNALRRWLLFYDFRADLDFAAWKESAYRGRPCLRAKKSCKEPQEMKFEFYF